MVKRMANALLGRLGYEIRRVRSRVEGEAGFELYRHRTRDGRFDYEAYKEIQTKGNHRKLDHVWVREENIAFLADYVKRVVGAPAFGICHGTRRGKEQAWFRQHLGCEVLGTEISDTASQFPNTIQWDFHQVKDEWLDAVDFIYSNSFDHSYDPGACLDTWMGCIRRPGVCILEHSSGHEHANALDPFGASIEQMPNLIARWGNGRFFLRETLDAPSVPESLRYLKFLVIQRL